MGGSWRVSPTMMSCSACARCGEMWRDVARCGEMWEMWGDELLRLREVQGDVARCGEMWGGVGRCREMSCSACARYREMWRDVARREMWRDVGDV